MKTILWVLILSSLLITSCTKEITDVKISDPSAYNMKLIPASPTSHDQIKLIVYDDCTYNVLSGITREGNTIIVEKQFNSMMKWPCMMENDTIEIGQLPEGTYLIHYKLKDLSTQVSNSLALSLYFKLKVTE